MRGAYAALKARAAARLRARALAFLFPDGEPTVDCSTRGGHAFRNGRCVWCHIHEPIFLDEVL